MRSKDGWDVSIGAAELGDRFGLSVARLHFLVPVVLHVTTRLGIMFSIASCLGLIAIVRCNRSRSLPNDAATGP